MRVPAALRRGAPGHLQPGLLPDVRHAATGPGHQRGPGRPDDGAADRDRSAGGVAVAAVQVVAAVRRTHGSLPSRSPCRLDYRVSCGYHLRQVWALAPIEAGGGTGQPAPLGRRGGA